MSGMDLRQLRHFLAIVDEGSFGRAAMALGTTQQALSTSITKLEASLGVRLFDRGPGGTKSTLSGTMLVRRARLITSEADRAREELELLAQASVGEVRLGIGESLAGRIVPQAVAALQAGSPKLRISLREGYTEHLLESLRDGELDLVAGAPPASAHAMRGISRSLLAQTRDEVLARADHPLAGRTGLAIGDLAGFTWLIGSYRSDMYEAVCAAFVAADMAPPENIIWSDAIATGLALLLKNDYLTLAATDILAPLVDQGMLVRIDVRGPRLVRQAALFRRQDVSLSPPAEALSRAILDAARAADSPGAQGDPMPAS